MELDADDEHDSRIQITVLGDGGCGGCSPVPDEACLQLAAHWLEEATTMVHGGEEVR